MSNSVPNIFLIHTLLYRKDAKTQRVFDRITPEFFREDGQDNSRKVVFSCDITPHWLRKDILKILCILSKNVFQANPYL